MKTNLFSVVVSLAMLMVSSLVHAQSSSHMDLEAKFDSANTFYERGEFLKALESYEEILSKSSHFESEYNAGNAAYKSGNLGRARLHYERAMRLNPSHSDLNTNLEFLIANSLEDKITPLPSIGFKKKIMSFFGSGYFTWWSWFAFICWTLGWLVFIIRMSQRVPYWRNVLATAGALLLTFGVLGLSAAYHSFQAGQSPDLAVMVSSQVDVHSGPSEEATVLFQLHEGTAGCLIQRRDGWDEIQLENGNKGWIRSEDAEDV